MDHYIEIKILPDPEFPASTLMNAMFNKLHKTLFDLQSNQIGVSFPDYGKTLGDRLRLHGKKDSLTKLNETNWLGRMKDYCQQSPIQPIPDNVQYRTVFRHQDTRSNAKIRRLLKRQEQGRRGSKPALTKQDIDAYENERVNAYQKGPYLDLNSSKGQRYRRYILMGELLGKPNDGEFDKFGLSKIATIPWF